jgi:hypothetical protein
MEQGTRTLVVGGTVAQDIFIRATSEWAYGPDDQDIFIRATSEWAYGPDDVWCDSRATEHRTAVAGAQQVAAHAMIDQANPKWIDDCRNDHDNIFLPSVWVHGPDYLLCTVLFAFSVFDGGWDRRRSE